MRETCISLLAWLILALPMSVSGSADGHILEVKDLRAASQQAKEQGLVLMLEFSSDYCSYCRRLEEEYLKPMLRSTEYDDKVIIRRINLDSYIQLVNFDGRSLSPSQFAAQYNVFVTPTLVFLNDRGEELADPLVGLGTEGFFGAYIDQHIAQARSRL